MGWLYMPRNGRSVKQVIEDAVRPGIAHDIAIVERRTAYVAYQPEGKHYVVALIFLLGYAPNSEYDIGYKDMDESVGPFETKCPKRILEKLSPVIDITGSEDSNAAMCMTQWREKCWEYHEHRDALKDLEAGDKIYIDGDERDVFEMVKVGKKIRWRRPENPYGLFHIVSWRDRATPLT